VVDLAVINKCLLSKSLWKLETSDGLWQEILRNKYVKYNFVANCKVRLGQSHFWQGLMHVKNDFFRFCKKK
jgi:hypothetical protein